MSSSAPPEPLPPPVPAPPNPPGPRIHWRLLVVRLLLGWVPPFVASRARTLALRAAGLRIGRGSLFWSLPTLVGSTSFPRTLRIGQLCGFNKGCYFELDAPIQIGDHVAVGHQVAFLTSGSHPASSTNSAGPAPIVVCDGVWLGARATLLAGVTIGAGSVVGAGVTVSQDVPAHTLLSGARPVSIARWR